MTENNPLDVDALRERMLLYLEGQITGEGFAQLHHELAHSDAARRAWVEVCTHVGLVDQVFNHRARHTPFRPASGGMNWRTWAVAACLVVGLGAVMTMLVSFGGSRRGAVDQPQVATITDTENAVFAPSDLPTEPGKPLHGGTLHLKSGRAEVTFVSGAQVQLIGPCVFGLNSPMRGWIRSGSLRAIVPHKVHGFTIAAPGVAVVDLGTEFDVTVNPASGTRVSVLKGRVRLEPDAGKPVELREHAAAMVDPKARTLMQQVTITTADGSGEDAFIQSDGKPMHNEEVLIIKRFDQRSDLNRRGYLQFDLKSLDDQRVTGAALELTCRLLSERTLTVDVWAMDEELPHGWSADGRFDWNSAPGLLRDHSGEVDPSQARHLGAFIVPSNTHVGGTVRFESPELMREVRGRAGGAVTLILIPREFSKTGTCFASSRAGRDTAPRLVVTTNAIDTGTQPAAASTPSSRTPVPPRRPKPRPTQPRRGARRVSLPKWKVHDGKRNVF